MSETICRWGILGTAGIARKNWKAIRNAGNCTLAAVASRDVERSRRFIDECQSHAPFDRPPRALGSYEELLADDGVDAVYIPLPTGIRKQWVIRAAEAGKHVLVEKPVGVTAADVREMLDACRQHGVQFMDGVMFMHSRRLESMRAILDDGLSVGQLKRIASHFTYCADSDFLAHDIRTHSELEPLGCLGDLGWYNIRFTLWTMNWQLPTRVSGRILSEHRRADSPAAVPSEFSGEMFFDGGVSASFYCSFLTEMQQWASLGGTKGYICVPDFVLPNYGAELVFELCNPTFTVNGCDFTMEEHSRRVAVPEYSNSAENSQEANMFRHFADLALAGTPEQHWGEVALQTQQVLDACLLSARGGARIVELPG